VGTSLTNLQCYIADGDDFLWHVTQWHMVASPQCWGERWNPEYRSILHKTVVSLKKAMATVFRDITESVLFISCCIVRQWLQWHIRPCYNTRGLACLPFYQQGTENLIHWQLPE
jgi:hypothetical protein